SSAFTRCILATSCRTSTRRSCNCSAWTGSDCKSPGEDGLTSNADVQSARSWRESRVCLLVNQSPHAEAQRNAEKREGKTESKGPAVVPPSPSPLGSALLREGFGFRVSPRAAERAGRGCAGSNRD